MHQSGLGRHVGKRSVAIVLEKMIGRFLSSGKPFQARAVHQKNVEPAVVVVIIESHAAPGRLEKVFVLVLAAVDGFCSESGFPGHIHKGDAQILSRSRGSQRRSSGILERCANRCARPCPPPGHRQRQRQNSFKRKHQRGPAKRAEKFAACGSQSDRTFPEEGRAGIPPFLL